MSGVGPTLVIAGAQKAGTTSLFFLLGEHPDVYASPVKEPSYFSELERVRPGGGVGVPERSRAVVSDRAAYVKLFEGGAGHRHRLEASTSYLSEPGVPAAMMAFDPSIRVIAVLRDPAERAHSAYNHLRSRGLEPLSSFAEALGAEPDRLATGWPHSYGYHRLSCYGDHLERFLAVVPSDRLLILGYRQLIDDPLAAVRRVEEFAGLRPFDGYRPGVRHNATGTPRLASLQRLIDLPAPRLRGRVRKALPSAAQRAVVATRNWNLAPPPALEPEERRDLIERLEPQIRKVRAIAGGAMVEGWERA